MATIRLNQEHRHYLLGLMRTTVKCPAEEKAVKTVQEKLAPLAKKMVTDRYPQKDMEILRKYEKAGVERQLNIQLTAGGVTQYTFDVDKNKSDADLYKDGDLALAPTYDHYRPPMYVADEKFTTLANSCVLLEKAYKDAIDQKYRDYGALIQASTTLEQVEEVWPEAKVLRKRIEATLPVVLSDEVMARIKNDSKTRLKVDNVEVDENFVREPRRRVTKTTQIEDLDN